MQKMLNCYTMDETDVVVFFNLKRISEVVFKHVQLDLHGEFSYIYIYPVTLEITSIV